MKIANINSVNQNIHKSPNFGKLKDVQFEDMFFPKYNDEYMDCFKSFMDSPDFQRFCNDYDVKATFRTKYISKDESIFGEAKGFADLDLEIIEINKKRDKEAPEKPKGFLSRLKQVFYISNKSDPVLIEISGTARSRSDAAIVLNNQIKKLTYSDLEDLYNKEKAKDKERLEQEKARKAEMKDYMSRIGK